MKKALTWLCKGGTLALFLLPFIALAQTNAGGLVPCGNGPDILAATSCNLCDFGHLVQNIINWLIAISVPISALLFAYAGFLSYTAGGESAQLVRAKKIFFSAVVGFIIVLASWLVVQVIINMLMNNKFYTNGLSWNTLDCINSTSRDARKRNSSIGDLLGTLGNSNQNTVTGGGGTNSLGVQCTNTNTECNAAAIKAAGYTDTQAAVMSCIANTESGGDPNVINPDGGACGLFQILPSNWNNPALHAGTCSVQTPCTDAACNAQSAYLLSQGRVQRGQSPYGDWTCPGCNNKAASCVQQYGGGAGGNTSGAAQTISI